MDLLGVSPIDVAATAPSRAAAAPAPSSSPLAVSNALLAPHGATAPARGVTAPAPATVAAEYKLVEYKDAVQTLTGVDMNTAFVLVDTQPAVSTLPSLTSEKLNEAGLTESNILALSARAIIKAISDPNSCGNLRTYLFELPKESYEITEILGEQIVFIAMVHHLFLLARIQNNAMPVLSEGYEACMGAMVEMLKKEKQRTVSVFGRSFAELKSLYNELHEAHVGPIGSSEVTLTSGSKGSRNSPRGQTFISFLDMLHKEPTEIHEYFTNALTVSQIPNDISLHEVSGDDEQAGVEHLSPEVDEGSVDEGSDASDPKPSSTASNTSNPPSAATVARNLGNMSDILGSPAVTAQLPSATRASSPPPALSLATNLEETAAKGIGRHAREPSPSSTSTIRLQPTTSPTRSESAMEEPGWGGEENEAPLATLSLEQVSSNASALAGPRAPTINPLEPLLENVNNNNAATVYNPIQSNTKSVGSVMPGRTLSRERGSRTLTAKRGGRRTWKRSRQAKNRTRKN